MTDSWFGDSPASPTPRLKLIPDYFWKKFEILSVYLFGLPVDNRKKGNTFFQTFVRPKTCPKFTRNPLQNRNLDWQNLVKFIIIFVS